MLVGSVGEEAQQVGPGQHADRLAVLDDEDRVGLLQLVPGRGDRLAGADEGRPASMCFSTESNRCAWPVKSASSNARSLTDPATSPDMTGGSALTTGICETPNSRRMWTASRIVSLGCVWTSAGISPDLPCEHLADGLLVVVVEEAVGGHPLVVEDLGHVAAARVGQEHDDHGVLGPVRLAATQRRDDGHAARAAHEQALLAGEAAGHVERVRVGHGDDLVDDRGVVGARPEVLADALDEVGPAGAAE